MRYPPICRLTLYTIFLLASWQLTDAGPLHADSIDARNAVRALQAELNGEPERAARWSEFLQIAELNDALESPQPSEEMLNETIGKLQSVRHVPSHVQLQALVDGLTAFANDPQDTRQISQQLRDFRQHLASLGASGKGWQQLLPLDDLDRLIGAEDKSTDPWRSELTAGRKLIEAEAGIQDRTSFEALRRALLNLKSGDGEPLTDRLAQMVRDAKLRYRPATFDQLEDARRRLEGSMVELDAFLSRGTAENAERWKKFLRWNELQAIRDAAEEPRLFRLARVFQRLQSGENGLQLPVFRRLSRDLERYLELMNSYDSQANRLVAAKRDLENVTLQLDRFLQTAPPKREQAWKRFLDWDVMQSLLQEDSRDLRAYNRVLRKYESDTPGLELYPYRRVGSRLAKFMEVIALQQRTPVVDQFDARMEQLARAVQEQSNAPSVANLTSLTENLNWLETTNRLPDLQTQLKSRFAAPNFGLRISSQVIERALSDTASRTNPVGLCFFGSWVSGKSHSNVAYRPRLVPSADNVIMEMRVAGTSLSQTVARKRKVNVFAQGHTVLSATKQLRYDGRRIDAAPAIPQASTVQQIRGAHVDRLVGQRLIRRLALRRACRLRPCAEECSNCQARNLLAQQMDAQAVEMLQTANQRLQNLEQRLRSQRMYPDALQVSSTAEAMFLQAQLLCSGALAAPGSPPSVPEPSDVLVQIHESAVNNLLADRMRGVKIDNKSIVDQMQKMGLAVPPELQAGAENDTQDSSAENGKFQLNPPANAQDPQDVNEQDVDADEPWSMQFDRTQPVAVEFRDGKVRITVRGFNFTRGDQQIDDTIEMTATYQFIYTPHRGLRARRTDEVEIKFIGAGERLSTRQITYKTFLARRANALFRQEMSLDDLPAGEMRERAKELPPRLVYSREGWLSLGVNVKDEMLKELGIGT